MSEKDLIVSAARIKPQWPMTERRVLCSADAEAIQEEIEREQERLFVDDDEINITVIEVKHGKNTCRTFTELDEIRDYCSEGREDGTIRILLIPQTTSWGELKISWAAFQLILGNFDISPEFWTITRLFGSKTSAEQESDGGISELSWDENLISLGLSYCLKYAAEHGRPDCYDPWSLRQTGVHHAFQQRTAENTFVILNPSEPLRKHLENLQGDITPHDIHRIVMHAATVQWSSYIDYLESQCDDLSKKAILSNTTIRKTTIAAWGLEVQFQDTQRIQRLQDIIFRASHMIDLNLGILAEILNPASLLSSTIPLSKSSQAGISSLSAQTQVRKLRLESLLRRLDGISTLVRSILDALASQALQASSRTTAELAGLAREDSKMNAISAKKATQDGRTLKTITILTLIYLPASFVATLLGTQYIHVDSVRGQIVISVASEMWIFGILTIILLLMTLGTWLYFEWRNRVLDRAAAAKNKSII